LDHSSLVLSPHDFDENSDGLLNVQITVAAFSQELQELFGLEVPIFIILKDPGKV